MYNENISLHEQVVELSNNLTSASQAPDRRQAIRDYPKQLFNEVATFNVLDEIMPSRSSQMRQSRQLVQEDYI